MGKWIRVLLLLSAPVTHGIAAAAIQDPIAHWDFSDGSGSVLHDRIGNGHDGTIVNAVWARAGHSPALQFDGDGDYVEIGPGPLAAMTGDVTIAAWVRLDASPYPNYHTNYVIVDCETYQASGYLLRIDGYSGKPYFRTSQADASTGGFADLAVQNQSVHHVVFARAAAKRQGRFFLDGVPIGTVPVADPVPASGSFRISQQSQSFQGQIRDLRLFGRCLSHGDVIALYSQGAADAGKDVSWLGKVRLKSFYYGGDEELLVEVNVMGVLPLTEHDSVVVEVGPRGGAAVETRTLEVAPESGVEALAFPLRGLQPGLCEVRALHVRNGAVASRTAVTFQHPAPSPRVPSPQEVKVGMLPASAPVPVFTVSVTEHGGMVIEAGDERLLVESSFSFPHGGENAFACARPSAGPEPSWSVHCSESAAAAEGGVAEVVGEGGFYRVRRRITRYANRVNIRDTFTNKLDGALGVILSHRVESASGEFRDARLAGNSASTVVQDRRLRTNPTVFARRPGLGVGLIALDDVFIVQALGAFDKKSAGISSTSFALDAHASYTLEWALYLNGSGDYYDVVNAVRRDEGRNGVTVKGGFSFFSPRHQAPDAAFFARRNLKYLSAPCLSHAADDPQVSIEGIEFIDFPEERRRLQAAFAQIRAEHPDVHLMFHIAHSLYCTNKPGDLFADARVLDANGQQVVYPYNYKAYGYFSKERVEANWRWWIFYPTLDNSFFKAMMRSLDVMMDEIGVDGAFLDGYMWGYGSEFTYDRWDGHTADIDPATKTITRKKGNVLLLSQPAMVAYTQKILDRGGVVVANGVVVTRTIGRLPILTDAEVTEGPLVHLAQTPVCLGAAPSLRSAADVYRDVHNKLKWANLYFYYGGDPYITRRSVPAAMYPITVQELHSGTIVGRERIITRNSGVYGWPADTGGSDLHFVHLFDARGREVPHGFITTVDEAGVRTQVQLKEMELAVIRRVPVLVEARQPVNLICTGYSVDGIGLTLNGTGRARFKVTDGEFRVAPGSGFALQSTAPRALNADATGVLTFSVDLTGSLEATLTAR